MIRGGTSSQKSPNLEVIVLCIAVGERGRERHAVIRNAAKKWRERGKGGFDGDFN